MVSASSFFSTSSFVLLLLLDLFQDNVDNVEFDNNDNGSAHDQVLEHVHEQVHVDGDGYGGWNFYKKRSVPLFSFFFLFSIFFF